MKISLISLGCSKNLVDSELILGSLTKSGHTLSNEQDADVIIVNTCGFIGDAKRESIDTILESAKYKEAGSCRKLIVTGCMVERYADELKENIPEVDAFWGTGELLRINELLGNGGIDSPSIQQINLHTQGTLYDPDSPRVMLSAPHTAYVKVSEGCSRTCSFCIIPKMRGLMRSRSIPSIKGELEMLAARGVKEINLIAQDMTSYGRDIDTDLETLLRQLATVQEIEWIRLHYCYPWGVTDSLVELISREQRILPYIDMPIQHINDRILAAMDRATPSKRIRSIIEKLRSSIPDVTIRTTLIVGFPGETDEEFDELIEFLGEAEFDRLGAFTYSQEEGTKAALLENQLDEDTKAFRLERLMEVQSEVSLHKNRSLIGREFQGIVETEQEDQYVARVSSQAPEVDGNTYIKKNGVSLPIGEVVQIRITDADIYDLYGEIAE